MNNAMILDIGMKHLADKLGLVDAEKFIALISREPFDYTEWRKENLFVGMSIKEISNAARVYCENE